MAQHEATPTVRGAVAVTPIPTAPGYVEAQFQNISHYAKFFVPLIGAVLTTFIQLSGHGNGLYLTLSILVAIGAAYATFQGSSTDKVLTSVKFWVNVAAVIAQAVLAVVGEGGNLAGVTMTQWAAIALSVLTTLGVVVIPNGAQFSTQIVKVPDANGVYDVTSLPADEPVAAPEPVTVPTDDEPEPPSKLNTHL